MEALAQHAGGLPNKRARIGEDADNLAALDLKLSEVEAYESHDEDEVQSCRTKSAGRGAAIFSGVHSK
jgi:hypothetical protein